MGDLIPADRLAQKRAERNLAERQPMAWRTRRGRWHIAALAVLTALAGGYLVIRDGEQPASPEAHLLVQDRFARLGSYPFEVSGLVELECDQEPGQQPVVNATAHMVSRFDGPAPSRGKVIEVPGIISSAMDCTEATTALRQDASPITAGIREHYEVAVQQMGDHGSVEAGERHAAWIAEASQAAVPARPLQ